MGIDSNSGGLARLFEQFGGGGLSSGWSASSQIPAPPPMPLRMVFTNRRGRISYAVLTGDRHVGTRRRLGNAERLARQVGGYVLPLGGGFEWSLPVVVNDFESEGGLTTVEFSMRGKPTWRRG